MCFKIFKLLNIGTVKPWYLKLNGAEKKLNISVRDTCNHTVKISILKYIYSETMVRTSNFWHIQDFQDMVQYTFRWKIPKFDWFFFLPYYTLIQYIHTSFLLYILTVNNDQYYVYSESTTLGNTAHQYIIIITISTSIQYLYSLESTI